MYEVDDTFFDDRLGNGPDAVEARRVTDEVKRELVRFGEPQSYECTQRPNQVWEVSIPVGAKWVVFCYEFDEDAAVIYLRYRKWNRTRHALQILRELLVNAPEGER